MQDGILGGYVCPKCGHIDLADGDSVPYAELKRLYETLQVTMAKDAKAAWSENRSLREVISKLRAEVRAQAYRILGDDEEFLAVLAEANVHNIKHIIQHRCMQIENRRLLIRVDQLERTAGRETEEDQVWDMTPEEYDKLSMEFKGG